MKKIITVIGARPQIIKAAAISRAIKNNFSDKILEVIVHTGQHYDENMSQIFFEELEIPFPNYNLNVGSGSHGEQTAKMLEGLENIYVQEKPDAVIVYGDTNSTIAAALAAAKIHIPVIHIEAGLRSFNKAMPEEINRIACDHMSTLLFTPSETGHRNLLNEGIKNDQKEAATIQDIEQIIQNYLLNSPFIQKDFSLSQMSFDLKIPERFLSNYFNKILVISFSEWRKNLRIEYVCSLIEAGESKNLTIEAIATNAGFASRSKFIDAFKERKGVTPSAFIKSMSSKEA